MTKKVLFLTALIFGIGVGGLAVPFSGSWEVDMTFDLRVPATGFRTILTVNYTIADWAFSSVSELQGGAGWHKQDFLAKGMINAFDLTNHLRFDPAALTFTFLRSTAAASIAGVDFNSQMLIIPNGSGLRLAYSAPVEDLRFAAAAYFGSLYFDPPDVELDPELKWKVIDPPTHEPIFRGLDIDITMPFYSTTLMIDADFTSEYGFQDITFSVPRFPLGIPGFTLDLAATYRIDVTEVIITPHITVDEWIHFKPFLSVDWYEGVIRGLTLEGLQLEWFPTDEIRFRYHFDARPNIEPHVVRGYDYCPAFGSPHKQMVELRYRAAPITLTIAGFWYSWFGVDPLPAFPNWLDIDLIVNILPGLTIRTGLYVEDTALAYITFGFTATW